MKINKYLLYCFCIHSTIDKNTTIAINTHSVDHTLKFPHKIRVNSLQIMDLSCKELLLRINFLELNRENVYELNIINQYKKRIYKIQNFLTADNQILPSDLSNVERLMLLGVYWKQISDIDKILLKIYTHTFKYI